MRAIGKSYSTVEHCFLHENFFSKLTQMVVFIHDLSRKDFGFIQNSLFNLFDPDLEKQIKLTEPYSICILKRISHLQKR